MERHLITLLICVCVSLLQVLTLEYTSSWNGAPLGETTPSFILFDKSLKECLYACAMRPWCKVTISMVFCHIFFDTISPEEQQCSKRDCKEQDTSMMFVEREKIISQDIAKCDKACPQDSTGLLKTCDFTSEASNCSTDACPPFNKMDPNGKFLGNTHEIGHKRRLLCNFGFHPIDPNNVTSECRAGRWVNVTTCVQEECVLIQELFEGSTYTFAIRSRRNFNDSVAFCQNCGYRVVTIESEGEQTFLADIMKFHVPTPRPYTLTGDNDGFFLGFYKSGQQLLRMDNHSSVIFRQFGKDQPSNYLNEHWIATLGIDNWLWHDVSLQDKFQTVCESEL